MLKKIKAKLQKLASTIKRKVIDLYYWILNHRDETVAIVVTLVAVASGARKLVKSLQPTQYEKERRRIDHTWYDPHTGISWDLKKKPTNAQKEVIDLASKAKEPMGPVLKELKLI